MLLDQDHLTTAYPELTVSGGRGATRHAALRRGARAARHQGERATATTSKARSCAGPATSSSPTAEPSARFRPLWWRTYRYVELDDRDGRGAADHRRPLRRRHVAIRSRARARLDAGAPELDRILEVGWRTARLCAHETYMDCPYYEQLQYAGDTRIQALVSLYMTGDGRLMRNAIAQLDDSRTSEGLTQSRAPSRLQQYIPPFSLWWIGMVHDYWRYQDDPAFVRAMLPGVRAVLAFFADRQTRGRLARPAALVELRRLGAGLAARRAAPCARRRAPRPSTCSSCSPTAARPDLEQAVGSPARAGGVSRVGRAAARDDPAAVLGRGARTLRGHARAHAVLAARERARGPGRRGRGRGGARGHGPRSRATRRWRPASIYFRHYLHAALQSDGPGRPLPRAARALAPDAGRGPHDVGGDGRARLRSDCHAWGASPNFELFRTVLGIDSAAPGFRRVIIRPFLGRLTRASGAIPHPRGEIAVSLARTATGSTRRFACPKASRASSCGATRGGRCPLVVRN